MEMETRESIRIIAKGSDGKAHDIHHIVTPAAEGRLERMEWFLSTGVKLTTDDGITFTVAGENLVLTRVGEKTDD